VRKPKLLSTRTWTKGSIGKMRKVDSFVKESQRIGIGGGTFSFPEPPRMNDSLYNCSSESFIVSMVRRVMKDFTFSNDITLPAGIIDIAVATHATHMDEVSNFSTMILTEVFLFAKIYENPRQFQGFR